MFAWLRRLLRREPREETAAELMEQALDYAEQQRRRKVQRELRRLGSMRHMEVPGKHPAIRTRRSRSLRGR